jgi:hypothetical protein
VFRASFQKLIQEINTFLVIAHHDFERDPVFMKTSQGGHKVKFAYEDPPKFLKISQFTPESWISTSRPIFVEPSSTVNLLENVPIGSLTLVCPVITFLAVDY